MLATAVATSFWATGLGHLLTELLSPIAVGLLAYGAWKFFHGKRGAALVAVVLAVFCVAPTVASSALGAGRTLLNTATTSLNQMAGHAGASSSGATTTTIAPAASSSGGGSEVPTATTTPLAPPASTPTAAPSATGS